jgi:hypothetical protein
MVPFVWRVAYKVREQDHIRDRISVTETAICAVSTV